MVEAIPELLCSTNLIQRAHYEPPWANTRIVGVAGSSGSGKTSMTLAIIRKLSLPWVVILSMVCRAAFLLISA
jgi:uridine kinase